METYIKDLPYGDIVLEDKRGPHDDAGADIGDRVYYISAERDIFSYMPALHPKNRYFSQQGSYRGSDRRISRDQDQIGNYIHCRAQ